MDVSDILRDRMQEPAGGRQMAVVSALLHGAIAAVVILAPTAWFSQRVETPREVMTISLDSGTPGPESGGLTAIPGRAIQAIRPPEEMNKPEPIRPPAQKAPEMTIPERGARARTGATNIKEAPPEARGRTPTRGAETSVGASLAETGVRGQGFGLSTGGGAGSGSRLDVDNFCCPEYIALMLQRIRENWRQQVETSGVSIVKFTIQRDGAITNIVLEKSSGFPVLDLNAQRALMSTRQLTPLPVQFPNPTLPVHLTFEYTR